MVEAVSKWRFSLKSPRCNPRTVPDLLRLHLAHPGLTNEIVNHDLELLAKRPLLPKRSHGAETHSQKFDLCRGDMRALASTGRRDPECSRFAAPPTGFNRTPKDHHVLVRRMRMDRNNGATRESRSMNRPVLHRPRQRQQSHARQEVDRSPTGCITIDESLRSCHYGIPLMKIISFPRRTIATRQQ
jgi:hypothetical protein